MRSVLVAPSSLAALAFLVLAGCTQPTGTAGETPPPASAAAGALPSVPEPASHAAGVPIATVLTHDSKVTILSRGGGELNVVVRSGDGTIVADGISLDQLRKTDPQLHAIVTSSYASNGHPYLDATNDRFFTAD